MNAQKLAKALRLAADALEEDPDYFHKTAHLDAEEEREAEQLISKLMTGGKDATS